MEFKKKYTKTLLKKNIKNCFTNDKKIKQNN